MKQIWCQITNITDTKAKLQVENPNWKCPYVYKKSLEPADLFIYNNLER